MTTIRTRLRILISALLIASLLITLLILNAYNKIESDLNETTTANQVARDIFALNGLLHDFLATREARPRLQWQNLYSDLGLNIERINPEDLSPTELQWVRQIRENYPHLEKLFTALSEAYVGGESNHSAVTKQILSQSLVLRSSLIVQAANQLSILSLKEIHSTKNNVFLLLGFAVTSLLFIVGLLIVTKRQIARSLESLQTGTQALGKGEFTHVIEVPGRNEFTHLATTFNTMASQLGGSYQKLAASNESLRVALEEREAKEQSLVLMAQRLSLATKAAQIGVWDWDVVTNKLYWDANMYQFYGLPPTVQVDYGTWRAAVHPEDFAMAEASLLSTLASKSHGTREFRILRGDCEVRYIQSSEIVVLDSKGVAINVIGVNIDVTERKLTADAIQRISTLQRAILDSANFSIISTDISGTIRVFNECAQRMLGYREHEMVNKVTPALIHDADEVVARARVLTQELGYEVPSGFETFIAKARSGKADENEWTYIRKDGSRFPVLLSVTALHNNLGEVDGFLGVAYDVSERKRLERMQREFVSIVSHELRTPLTAIRGALGLVSAEAVGILPPRAKDMTIIALNNCDRLVRLINDILDIEKIESGKMDFDMRPVEMSELIRETVEATKSYGQKYDVFIVTSRNLPQLEVIGDKDRLIQVLTNLISNACKFSPAKGTVRVTLTVRDEFVQIAVEDKGRGIPESFQQQMFEKFCQADSSDTREKGGTGLGLNISRAIVEKHGGKIEFESREGHGTRFWMTLPLKVRALASA